VGECILRRGDSDVLFSNDFGRTISMTLSSIITHAAGFSPGQSVSPLVGLSVCLSVCPSVGPKSVLWQNGGRDPDAVSGDEWDR